LWSSYPGAAKVQQVMYPLNQQALDPMKAALWNFPMLRLAKLEAIMHAGTSLIHALLMHPAIAGSFL